MAKDTPINAKVPWGAAGAAGGSMVGNAVADLITTGLTSGLGWNLSPTNVLSIEILTIAVLTYLAAYGTGYMKDSGFTVKEQAAELKDAKERDKK